MQEPIPVVHDTGGVRPSLIQLTHVIYALHACAVFVGVTSSVATVAGGFVFGLPSLLAVFLNYLKRGDVAGTWLESHFTWQIRTFWWSLLWCVLGVLTLFLMVGFVILFVAAIWSVYRLVKGWLYWNDRRPMPV